MLCSLANEDLGLERCDGVSIFFIANKQKGEGSSLWFYCMISEYRGLFMDDTSNWLPKNNLPFGRSCDSDHAFHLFQNLWQS